MGNEGSCADPVAGYGAGLAGGRSTSSIAGSPLGREPARRPAPAVAGPLVAPAGQESSDCQKNRPVLRGNLLERAPERWLKSAHAPNVMRGIWPKKFSDGRAEGASQLLKHLERRQLFAAFDSANIGKVHPAGDPLG